MKHADCHVDVPHHARGLCRPCWQRRRRKQQKLWRMRKAGAPGVLPAKNQRIAQGILDGLGKVEKPVANICGARCDRMEVCSHVFRGGLYWAMLPHSRGRGHGPDA